MSNLISFQKFIDDISPTDDFCKLWKLELIMIDSINQLFGRTYNVIKIKLLLAFLSAPKFEEFIIGLKTIFLFCKEKENEDSISMFFEFLADTIGNILTRINLPSAFFTVLISFKEVLVQKFKKLVEEKANSLRGLLVVKFLNNFNNWIKHECQQNETVVMIFLESFADCLDSDTLEGVVGHLSNLYLSDPGFYFSKDAGRLQVDASRLGELKDYFLPSFLAFLKISLLRFREIFNSIFQRIKDLASSLIGALKIPGLLSKKLLLTEVISAFVEQIITALNEVSRFKPDISVDSEIVYLEGMKNEVHGFINKQIQDIWETVSKVISSDLRSQKRLIYSFDDFTIDFQQKFEKLGFNLTSCGNFDSFFNELGAKLGESLKLLRGIHLNTNQMREAESRIQEFLIKVYPRKLGGSLRFRKD